MSWESSSIVTGWSLGPRSQEVGEKLEWHSLLTLEDLLAACAHPVSTLYAPVTSAVMLPHPQGVILYHLRFLTVVNHNRYTPRAGVLLRI